MRFWSNMYEVRVERFVGAVLGIEEDHWQNSLWMIFRSNFELYTILPYYTYRKPVRKQTSHAYSYSNSLRGHTEYNRAHVKDMRPPVGTHIHR